MRALKKKKSDFNVQFVPGENRVQDSNPCFLGWHKRAELGQNSNQSNLRGEVWVMFWLDFNMNNLTDMIFDNMVGLTDMIFDRMVWLTY